MQTWSVGLFIAYASREPYQKFMTEALFELEAALPRDLPYRLMIVKVYGISGSDHPVANAHVGLNKGLTFL